MTAPLSLASLAPEPDPRQVLIRIEGLNKHYGAYHVLHDIDLQVREGERIVLCGPSGSGKSTLIRCINRLEAHQSGRLIVDGVELDAGGQAHAARHWCKHVAALGIANGMLQLRAVTGAVAVSYTHLTLPTTPYV